LNPGPLSYQESVLPLNYLGTLTILSNDSISKKKNKAWAQACPSVKFVLKYSYWVGGGVVNRMWL
jgi:hypothetical protein